MCEKYKEYINEDQVIIHRPDGSKTIINGSPSLENCKTFIKILLLEKQRQKEKTLSKQ
ncbi:hypothetical protein D3C74_317930 [compost metagenome]